MKNKMETQESFVEQYYLADNAPKNIQSFMVWLDFIFARYLDDLLKDFDNKSWNITRIKNNIAKKWWLSKVLKLLFSDKIDFDSTDDFTVESLVSFLKKIGEFGEEISIKYPDIWSSAELEIRLNWWTPLELYGVYFFEDKKIKTRDMVLVEVFLRDYLKWKWVIENQEFIDKRNEDLNRYEFWVFLQRNIIPIANFWNWVFKIEKWENLIQLSLLLLSRLSDYKTDKFDLFISKLSDVDESVTSNINQLENNEKLIDFILDLFIEIFPEIYWQEYTKFRVKSVLLWEYGDSLEQCYLNLTPLDNFYFNKSDEIEPNTNDKFPDEPLILSIYEMIEWSPSINIFDINWKKVYWWDISEQHIIDLKWTYYILSEAKWFRNVPKFATWNIESLKPSKDEYRDAFIEIWKSFFSDWLEPPKDIVYLNPDYVRINAFWKIQWWKYIKNVTKIEL